MSDQAWKDLFEKAKKKATDEYAVEVSNLLRLTKSEVEAVIAEAKVDKEKLSDLMAIVTATAKTNRQKADAIRSTVGLAETAVALLAKLT